MAKYKIEYNNKVKTVTFRYLPKVTNLLDKLRYKDKGLSMGDIYRITAWKINRYPQLDDNVLKELNALKSKKKLDEDETKRVLQSLLKTDGIGLPMASTYLRFLNPNVYQIIDVRAFRAAFFYEGICIDKDGKTFVSLTTGTIENKIDLYIKYLKQLGDIAKGGYRDLKVKFEDLDRFLYDIDKKAGFKVSDKECSDECKKRWNKIIEDYKMNANGVRIEK